MKYSEINENLCGVDAFFALDTIDSTNDFLAKIRSDARVVACAAKEQTKGRGQYNRRWVSKKNSGAFVSVRFYFPPKFALGALGLVVGISVIRALEQYLKIDGLRLKWPNDIYHQGRKLGGILLENTIQKNAQRVIVGVGVNHYLDFDHPKSWTDLATILGRAADNAKLCVWLINTMVENVAIFQKQGFGFFHDTWCSYDDLCGRPVMYRHQNETRAGVAAGVDEDGALIVRLKSQTVRVYRSDDLSIIK